MKRGNGKGNSHRINEESKNQQLEAFREVNQGQVLTTDLGTKVSHTDDSLKAGERGPTLLEDFHFREKITHFDHEMIPERVVHARGSAAHGYFQVYEPMAEYTMAKFLQDPALKTPVFVRFSQVAGNRGSADTVRDVRGFATKFYTEDGNYDLVGNNIPVFFIQDAIKFPDLIHAVKGEPQHEMPQASTAHDTFWDFISLMPESTHMVMWIMSDRAITRSYRMMDGFGVNTFRFVNAQGKSRFVKFHWKPLLGVHSLVWDEAQKIAGKDPDFLRRDLWEAIEKGDYPEYELAVQMIEEEDEDNFDFDILDPTKVWPEEMIPLKRIGKLTLNRNPDNFFAETEQVAFCPGNVVPGIDFSDDPLLQGRLFSYIDTQISRLGGPNFTEIPINKPVAEKHNNQRDGMHRQTINPGRVQYFPNSLQENYPKPTGIEGEGFVSYPERIQGQKTRIRSRKFQDHFSQATMFWNSMSDVEKKHIVRAFHFEIGKVETRAVRERMVELLTNVDGELAAMVAKGIGVETPPAIRNSSSLKSPALSMENTLKNSIKSRKIAILASDGFNYNELTQVKKALEQAGAHTEVISKNLGYIKSSNGQEIRVDKNSITAASVLYDAVYIPGGRESIEMLQSQGDALHFVNEAFKHCKAIGATAEGIELLRQSEIQDIHLADQSKTMVDMGVVTTRNGRSLTTFNQKFIQGIQQHRAWERENARIKEQVAA
jgi:catalase